MAGENTTDFFVWCRLTMDSLLLLQDEVLRRSRCAAWPRVLAPPATTIMSGRSIPCFFRNLLIAWRMR